MEFLHGLCLSKDSDSRVPGYAVMLTEDAYICTLLNQTVDLRIVVGFADSKVRDNIVEDVSVE